MAISAKEEQRALDTEERELVGRTRHPAVKELPDAEVFQLVGLIRARRDRARTQAHRRRREMRGKAAPKGAASSAADDGSRLKLEVLSQALRRINAEADRRRREAAKMPGS